MANPIESPPPLRLIQGATNLIPVYELSFSGGTLSRLSPIRAQYSPPSASGGSNTLGMSNLGNTSGTTGVVSGSAIQILFAGGNNVTLSQSLNGVSGTITISAANETQTVPPIATQVTEVMSAGSTGTITRFAPEDHAHRGVNLVQISGNTSNTSNVVYGSVYLAGGNNITLSQVSAAGKATITISAANETQTVPPIATAVKEAVSTVASTGTITRFAPEDHMHQGINSAGISNVGNTSGTSGVSPGRLVLAGGNNITLSQATDATGSTVSVSAFNQTVPTLSYWSNFETLGNSQMTVLERSLFVYPLWANAPAIFPGNMTVSTLNLFLTYNFTNTSSQTGGQSSTFSIGFYTYNAGTLSLLNSGSTTWGFNAASDMSSNYNGPRILSLNSSLFASSLTFTPGHYWAAIWYQTSGQNITNLSWLLANAGFNAQVSGTVGTSTATATSMGIMPFAPGAYSVSFSSGMPASLAQSDMSHAIAGYTRAVPGIAFNNLTGKF